jgi:hypothetical protein
MPALPQQARNFLAMTLRRTGGSVALLIAFALSVNAAGPLALPRQTISPPASARAPLFVDVDGDGRSDLLVIDPVRNELLNYHQRPAGFTNTPDQILALPAQTAWVAPFDVEAHPGLELLISTPAGLAYSLQTGGVYETEKRPLIDAKQVFTSNDFPLLGLLATNLARHDSIPVISADQVVLYRHDANRQWHPDPATPLSITETAWNADDDSWTAGRRKAQSLRVRQSFRTKPDRQPDTLTEHAAVRKILDDMIKLGAIHPRGTNRADVNGDGRSDLLLWQVNGTLDFKTDLYLFLRGADQRLPERPTQILHCRGIAMPTGSTDEASLVSDLDGDGVCELILLELHTTVASPSGLLEMALSHGVDWSVTIRKFNGSGFSEKPAGSTLITAILPLDDLQDWPLFIHGDFNGDGRPDLLVRRSDTQWNIFPSTTNRSSGTWFAREPVLSFEAPPHGYPELNDLNGDHLADIIWHEPDNSRLSIFFSATRPQPPRNP